MMKEIVFEVLSEGGSLSIERIKDSDVVKFIYHHSEFDPMNEGSSDTIIIKNESDEVLYILPSDKYFISTSPILSKTKGWYYTNQL